MQSLPLLLLCWFSAPAPLPQDPCLKCRHQGVLPCDDHVDVPREEEEPSALTPVLNCSWAANCQKCGGTTWMDCPKCPSGERTKEIEEKRVHIRAWLESGQLEHKLGRAVPRIETKRFALVVDVIDLPVDDKRKKMMSGHVLAHQMARDCEHAAALVAEHYAIADMDFRAKMRMWLWPTLEKHQEAQQHFQRTISAGDFRVYGRDPCFSVWTEPKNFDTVPKVRTLFVHNATHLLLSNAFQPSWVGDIGGGWLDAGLGAWYEYELFGRVKNYCTEESSGLQDYEGGLWRAAVRRRLEREKEPFLPGLLQERTGQLAPDENALCWSFYDYLLAAHPGVVRKLMIELKQKKPAREVLPKELGMSLFAAEDAWRAWVGENYPLQGDDPKAPAKGKKR
jgi:hypothetical protein